MHNSPTSTGDITMNDLQDTPRWLSTGYLAAAPTGQVDREHGTIPGVSVATEGEAKGHGVFLDEEFVDTIIEQGNSKKQGLKARFGHPNMCSTALGTFLGRYKNFKKGTVERDDGSQAFKATADLFLSNEAKETPHGNLHQYVMNMAENEPDMFGTSIEFSPGRIYQKTKEGKKVYHVWKRGDDGEVLCNKEGTTLLAYVDEAGNEVDPGQEEIIERDYVECAALHGCDCVDSPAANDGLFSRFSQETIAGQITEFLDLNPQVWEALNGNEAVLGAIAQYGDRVSEFIRRYQEYQIGGDQMATQSHDKQNGVVEDQEPTQVEEPVEEAPQEDEAVPEVEDEQTEVVSAESDQADASPEEKSEVPAESEAVEEADEGSFERSEFKSLVDQFGADIASEVVLSGGGEADAYKLQAERVQKENEDLRKQLAQGGQGGKPAKYSEPGDARPQSVFRGNRK